MPAALEHGGVAPLIVDASADLDKAVPAILKGGYYHAGQVCVSVQRVFADASVADELIERLVAGVADLVVGDPLDAATQVGPLIRQGEVDRVEEWVREAEAAGAAVVAGGEPLDHQCYAPTLLVDPPADAKVMTDEVFGPLVNVTRTSGLDDAIARANSLPWAFQSAVLAQDVDAALRAEVEHNQNTIESLILQRDKAEAERDKARSDFASARALMCAPWNADTYLKLWTAEAQRDALLKAMRKIHGHDGTLICDVRCRIAAAAIKEASHE